MLSTLALMIVGLWAASPAHATTTSLDSVSFENSTFTDYSQQVLNVTWSADESPAENPVVVDFDLPSDLIGVATTFDIANGTCTVTTTHVTCTVDEDYVTENPNNIHGDFQIYVRTNLDNTETVTDQTFVIGGVTTPGVTINSRYCQTNCEFDYSTGQYKSGSYNASTDNITWTIQLPSTPSAEDGLSLEPGLTITVSDNFDDNPFTIVSGPTVYSAGCVTTDSYNYERPRYSALSTDDYTVAEDNLSVTFTTAEGGCTGSESGTDPWALDGRLYYVQWVVHADDGGKGVTGVGSYTNTAEVDIDGTSTSSTGSATRRTLSGSAIGDNYGRFSLSKLFEGNALTPDSVEIAYTVTYPDNVPDPTSGTITLSDDNSWTFTSDDIYVGSTVTLTEVDPWPSNVEQSAALVGPDGETIAANEDGSYTFTVTHSDSALAYVLTNTGVIPTVALPAQKVIENPDGVTIPEDTTFEITATWPEDADAAISAGTSTATLPADGSVVTFDPEIPEGATVTFTETSPTAIPGATWESSTVDPETLTVSSESESVTITATNVISRDTGSFSVTKELTGDAAELVDGVPFEIAYSYPANAELGIEAGSGTIEVLPGEEPVTVSVPAGAEVTLSENLVEVEGGTWATPVFDPSNTFTVGEDENVSIVLTNLITLNTGTFSIHKVVEGNAAGDVPSGTEFTVYYSYPAGSGFEAGDGELYVTDGETVESPELPYGAEVTLSEDAPDEISGLDWSDPEFSTTTVTIGDGTVVEVTLTNTITNPDLLAVTGGVISTTAIVAAILLLIAGLVLLLLKRRRRQQV
ncbi:MAG: DUF5979 domain-containing protein [Microbacterium sp.]|uniref:DUF5979 domain-containing protein n=1 Tax=Microbacterium sp. TaxID=51671 RepID=UPI0039E47678